MRNEKKYAITFATGSLLKPAMLKLKQASIQDGTRFSFICPEDIAINARICVENGPITTAVKSSMRIPAKGPVLLCCICVLPN